MQSPHPALPELCRLMGVSSLAGRSLEALVDKEGHEFDDIHSYVNQSIRSILYPQTSEKKDTFHNAEPVLSNFEKVSLVASDDISLKTEASPTCISGIHECFPPDDDDLCPNQPAAVPTTNKIQYPNSSKKAPYELVMCRRTLVSHIYSFLCPLSLDQVASCTREWSTIARPLRICGGLKSLLLRPLRHIRCLQASSRRDSLLRAMICVTDSTDGCSGMALEMGPFCDYAAVFDVPMLVISINSTIRLNNTEKYSPVAAYLAECMANEIDAAWQLHDVRTEDDMEDEVSGALAWLQEELEIDKICDLRIRSWV